MSAPSIFSDPSFYSTLGSITAHKPMPERRADEGRKPRLGARHPQGSCVLVGVACSGGRDAAACSKGLQRVACLLFSHSTAVLGHKCRPPQHGSSFTFIYYYNFTVDAFNDYFLSKAETLVKSQDSPDSVISSTPVKKRLVDFCQQKTKRTDSFTIPLMAVHELGKYIS